VVHSYLEATKRFPLNLQAWIVLRGRETASDKTCDVGAILGETAMYLDTIFSQSHLLQTWRKRGVPTI
jgi:hypothetical protein